MTDSFSTKNAKPKRMSAELEDWCDHGAPEEQRTVILRLDATADPDRVAEDLAQMDVEVVSSGAAVIVSNVARGAARSVSELPGVTRLDAPTRMQEKTTDSLLSGPAPRGRGFILPE